MKRGRKETPNNNRRAVWLLTKASIRYNSGRFWILTVAAALSITVLSAVFGISLGKIEAEYIQGARSSGTTASTMLERGTMDQYQAISQLSYIQSVGREKSPGNLLVGEDTVIGLNAMDPVAWEDMTLPAYTGVTGHYPQKEGELMLPLRALESMGIENPKEGMTISGTVKLFSEEGERQAIEQKMDFTLCSWYRDYVDPAVYPPAGYISESQLEAWGMSLKEPDRLLIQQNDTIDGYEVEAALYEDIPTIDRAQQFLGQSSIAYTTMEEFLGSYRMAGFCAALVLTCVFLLIYNVLYITMQKEIRQIGLLDTLGTTGKQIRKLYFSQTGLALGAGTGLGLILSAIVLLWLVPWALGNLYLYNYGKSAEMIRLRPQLLAASMVFTALVMAGATAWALRKAAAMNPVAALHYTGVESQPIRRKTGSRAGKAETGNPQTVNRRSRKSEREKPERLIQGRRKPGRQRRAGEEIWKMAWQNLTRYRVRFFLTILSLTLGIVMALGSIVMGVGTDYTNSIEQRNDFSIKADYMAFSDYEDQESVSSGEFVREYTPISQELKEQLWNIQGMLPEQSEIIRGGYAIVDNGAEVLQPMMEANSTQGLWTLTEEEQELQGQGQPGRSESATIQIAEEKYLDILEDYVEEKGLRADIEAVRQGRGILLLHNHELSPALQEEADKKVGLPLKLWQLPTREDLAKYLEKLPDSEENLEYENMGEMEISGYLDIRAKNFPDFNMTWHGAGIWYFLVSEKGFASLQSREVTFGMELNVEKDKEPGARAAIQKLLQKEQQKDKNMMYFLLVKAEDLASAQSYILTNRVISGALSGVLILLGLANYFNVLTTGMLSRKKELAVMESVGMTGKQIRTMLIQEGIFYWIIVTILTASLGTGVLQILHRYMDSKVAYFKYAYPWAGLMLILGMLLAICILLPLALYRQMEKDSLVKRIALFH